MNFINRTPRITLSLLIINIMFYIGQFMPLGIDFERLFVLYPLNSDSFIPHQILTHMFMHDSSFILHILFNMYGLYVFGSMLEKVLGERRFFMLYFLSGFGAFGLHWVFAHLGLTSDSRLLGASGCIFGLLAAFGTLYPEAKMSLIFPPITFSAKWIFPVTMVIALLSTQINMGNIGHVAHFGGALVGFLLIKYWKNNTTRIF